MEGFDELRSRIREVVRDNCHADITGQKMQDMLVLVADTSEAALDALSERVSALEAAAGAGGSSGGGVEEEVDE